MLQRTSTARPNLLLAAGILAACGGGSGENSGNIADGSTPSGSAKLVWFAPTTRTDGSPLEDLAGYHIYYSTGAGPRHLIRLGNPSAITWTVTGLSTGTWYFEMTAVDSMSIESEYTAVVSKTIR